MPKWAFAEDRQFDEFVEKAREYQWNASAGLDEQGPSKSYARDAEL